MAEREGFEPPLPLKVNRISSAARSTTLPPLRLRSAEPTSASKKRKPKISDSLERLDPTLDQTSIPEA